MKTKATSLLVVALLFSTICMAQKKITVEAQSYDISNNLDLKAVASLFGESKDLEDFEMRLNDYDSQISNLDMNNDGEVDYLRVVETSENNVHLVVIQAVLGRNDFQDVATIVVERKQNRRTYVQVIGDPFMYGNNYIVEPVYYYTPSIFSFFWSNRYYRWDSPYYWGYYPRYYHYRHPYEVNVYITHVNRYINVNHRYYYTDSRRNNNIERMASSVSRSDYSKRNPEQNFSSRNQNVPNKQELDRTRNDSRVLQTRTSNSESIRRGSNTEPRTIQNNSNARTPASNNEKNNVNRRESIPNGAGAPQNERSNELNRSRSETNASPSIQRENNSRSNSTTVEPKREVKSSENTKPARVERATPTEKSSNSRSEPKSVERKPAESNRSAQPSNQSRSSSSSSNRR